jgi:hypothetical protein
MIEIIIWLIFFPLATTLNRYFNDKIKILRGENPTEKEIKDKVDFIEAIVFVIVLIILIKG